MTGATEALCEFGRELDGAALPDRTRASARATVGNALALMVGAAGHPATDAAARTVASFAGAGAGTGTGAVPVPLLGRAERLPAVWAALVHGIAAHVEDFDDTHPPTVIHPGAPVVPAALSASVLTGANGAELLAAVTAGVEVALRVGTMLMPEALRRGWHMTGIAGPIGASIAAGRLLGLDHGQLVSAVGLAATQCAGTLEALGSMAKPLHPGKAAANGVEAALLAGRGLTGPAKAIEGRRGLLALHAGRVDLGAALDGLGERWEIERNEIKPYACGVVSHSIIDLAIDLAGQQGGVPPDTVRLNVNPFVLTAMGRAAPSSGLEAKFSATHCFAVGFLHGRAGPAQFKDVVVRDPEVVALRDRCLLVPDPALDRYQVRAEIVTADGSVRQLRRDHPAALGPDALEAKALSLAEPVLGVAAGDFVRRAFAPDDEESVAALMAAGRPAPK